MTLLENWRERRAPVFIILGVCYFMFIVVSCFGILGQDFVMVGFFLLVLGVLALLLWAVVWFLIFLYRTIFGRS